LIRSKLLLSFVNWPTEVDWESPAGILISALCRAIPAEKRTPVILFGSAALQMTVAPTLLSADADIAPDIVPYDPRSSRFVRPLDRTGLMDLVRAAQLGVGQRDFYIQVCAQGSFQPGTGWLRRIMEVERGGLVITIPHPMDILIAKLHRYEKKDLIAFKEVYRRQNFPSPEAMLAELRASPRLFMKRDRSVDHMPGQFPESKMAESLPKLWRDLWGLELDLRRDILEPMNAGLQDTYGDFDESAGDEFRAIGQLPPRLPPSEQPE